MTTSPVEETANSMSVLFSQQASQKRCTSSACGFPKRSQTMQVCFRHVMALLCYMAIHAGPEAAVDMPAMCRTSALGSELWIKKAAKGSRADSGEGLQ